MLFDSHLHIIDKRFPLVENNGYMPPEFTCNDYLESVQGLGVTAGAIVSGSFQAMDQSYLLSALEFMRSQNMPFVGVTQVPSTISDKELESLDRSGVRAVRFNVYRGGSESVKELANLAHRIYGLLGWHVELYIGAEALEQLAPTIRELPAVSIDHLGMDKSCQQLLLSLVSDGVKLKATGFGRIGFEPISFMKKVYQANPRALMFGTDLPSTRANRPFSVTDLELIQNSFSDEAFKNISWNNAAEFYQIK